MLEGHDSSSSRSRGIRTDECWLGDRAFIAIMVLAAALRLHDIASTAIWVDEANSILTAKQPWSVILEMLKRDSSPPLFYFLLKSWMALLGDGPTALRLSSSLFSLLLVAAVYRIGMHECSRRVGLWAAFFLAISPVQVFYSQQTRMYTLLPLLALAAWWLLVRYIRYGRARDFWLSMVATAAALYTHNFAVYVPLVHAVLVLASGQTFSRFRMWLLGTLFLLLVYAAWIPTLLTQLANADHYAWYLDRWRQDGFLGALANTLRSYSPAGSMVMYYRANSIEWYGVPTVITTGFAVWGTVVLVRGRSRLPRSTALWLPAACVVPLAASLVMSSVLTPHYVPGRVDQMMFPCFSLLAAVGISSLTPVTLQRLLVPLFLAVAIIGRGPFYSDFRKGGVDGAGADLAAAVMSEFRAGDVVLCTSLTRAPLEYYLQRSGVDVPILSYPRATARHLGSQNHEKLLADDAGLLKEARVVIDRARSRAEPGGRLILLRTDIPVNRYFERGHLERIFGLKEEARIGLFKLDGTKEFVWLTLNRLAPSSADLVPQRAGGGS